MNRSHFYQVEDAYPLTYLQKGMLFHSGYSQDSTVYHDITTYHLESSYHAESFQQVLQELIHRHAVLRTGFNLSEFNEMLQLVYTGADVPLQVISLEEMVPTEQELVIEQWIEQEKQNPFDYQQAPLLRVMIHLRSQSSFQMSISFHHAVLDGWSVASLVTELLQRYQAHLNGASLPVDELGHSFRDYVELELEALESDKTKEYWQQMLSRHSFNKLFGKTRMDQHLSIHKLNYGMVLDCSLTSRLQSLVKTIGVPLKTVLLAAHLRTLQFVSGDETITTGVVLNGRPEDADGERVLGLFLNTTPLCVTVKNQSWKELILCTFQAEQEIFCHRRFPMAELQLQNGGRPLFDASFNYIHFHVYNDIPVEGIRIVDRAFLEHNNFPLTTHFSVNPHTSDLRMVLSYDVNYLTEAEAARLLGYYKQVLRSMVEQPDTLLRSVTLLDGSETEQLEQWMTKVEGLYEGRALQKLFEDQVARAPDAVALMYEGRQLTYSELDARSNQVAHCLQRLGVGMDDRIGLCLEHSFDTFVGLIGALKAGAAYVPLDPEYPLERLMYILEDSDPSIILTQESLQHLFKSSPEGTVLCLDSDWERFSTESTQPLKWTGMMNSLAYLLYTSGSTGRPKGVAIEHRQIVNYVQNICERLSFEPGSAFALVQPLSFDSCHTSIFTALSTGGSLHIISRERSVSPQQLAECFAKQPIDYLKITPSHLNALMQGVEEPGQVLPNKALILGGEALRWDFVDQLHQSKPGLIVFNHYGPTEATVGMLTHRVQAGETRHSTLVPLGRPLGNTRAVLLDEYQQLVPIGVSGELFIGGDCLARGYWNLEEQNRNSFIENVQAASGERLYRTGDLMRLLPTGDLEYLGRKDSQVKIRGYRIELGEIETILSKHEAIQEVVVVSRTDDGMESRLVAYYVLNKHMEPPHLNDLRDLIGKSLPLYMAPSVFELLPELPKMSNGKLNQKALPKPTSFTSMQNYVEPRHSLEQQLVEIWENVLRVSPIGVRDDFFDLGGHSLLALQIMSRIQRNYGRNLPLHILFEKRTVEKLANALREEVETKSSSLVALRESGSKMPFFCVHPFGGHVFCYYDLMRHVDPERPFYALQARGLYGEAKPFHTIENMAAHYIQEIKRVQPEGPYLIGGWCLGGRVAFEMARQFTAQGDEIGFLAIIDEQIVSGGTSGPMRTNDLALLSYAIAQRLDVPIDDLYNLEPEEQLVAFYERAKEADALRFDIQDISQARLLWKIYKSHRLASTSYRELPYPGAAWIVRGSESHLPDTQEGDRGWGRVIDPSNMTFQLIPGNHFSILIPPFVQELSNKLSNMLDEAETKIKMSVNM